MYKYYKKNIKWKRECEHSVETSEFFCPFSFYVKSILEILGVIKRCHFCSFGSSEFYFWLVPALKILQNWPK